MLLLVVCRWLNMSEQMGAEEDDQVKKVVRNIQDN